MTHPLSDPRLIQRIVIVSANRKVCIRRIFQTKTTSRSFYIQFSATCRKCKKDHSIHLNGHGLFWLRYDRHTFKFFYLGKTLKYVV